LVFHATYQRGFDYDFLGCGILLRGPRRLAVSSEINQGAVRPRRRRWLWLFAALGVIALLLVLFAGGVTAWEFTNSTPFCGTTCHTMPPEYTAYLTSPHARVPCVDCHLGKEGVLYAIPRKVMEIRHLTDALTQAYHTPVYVKNLRPARFTCEKCHFPEKLSLDAVKEIRHYMPDQQNSEISTWLLLKTGGGSKRQGLGKGIHWHIENEVWYLPTDNLKQQIPYVKQVDQDGKVTEYVDVQAGLPADFVEKNQENLRRMDCIDCHNRVSHEFRSSDEMVDQSIQRGLIDPNIPEIKRVAVTALNRPYTNHQEAEQALQELTIWYETNYPDYYAQNQDKIRQAIDVLSENYRTSVFPDMDVGSQTHPDNLGHKDFPGCFRCHDGKHVSAENKTIRLECNICHTVPEVVKADEPRPALSLEKSGEPESHLDSNWIAKHRYSFDETCVLCHDVTNPGGSDNSSFCSNSACHATEWQFVGLDAPGIRALSAPPRVPSAGVPRAIPHPLGPRTDCTICHGAGKVHPNPENHASFTADMCTSCHQPRVQESAGAEMPAPATTTTPSTVTGTAPRIPHPLIGRDNCLMCHSPDSGIKPAPKDHVGRTIAACRSCHEPVAEGSPAPEPEVTPTGEGGGPKAIPHELAGREDCLLCHNPDSGVKPAPADHAGRTDDQCQMCHKPAGAASEATPEPEATAEQGGDSSAARPITHDLAGKEDCLVCHNPAGGLKPAPADHAGRTKDVCQACHKPLL
jgi:nitrate/TMAO reductase-like tetraheme cytochrome c subunit